MEATELKQGDPVSWDFIKRRKILTKHGVFVRLVRPKMRNSKRKAYVKFDNNMHESIVFISELKTV